jgi:hypothetical protein
MAQTDIETIEQLPIAPATPEEQKPIIELVDHMITLNKELRKVNTDFDRYLNLHPRIKDTPLKEYMDALQITDKEVLKDHYGNPASRIEGKIKEFEIRENGVWLVFRVGYLLKSGKGKETLIRIDAFRCRIEDVNLRKFLYYSIKAYTRPGTLGKGNIYERLLAIRLPRFYADAGRNAEAVSEIMTEYLAAVDSARSRRQIRRSMRGCMRCTGWGRGRYGWWKDENGIVSFACLPKIRRVYRVAGGSDRSGIGNERIPRSHELGRLRERTPRRWKTLMYTLSPMSSTIVIKWSTSSG